MLIKIFSYNIHGLPYISDTWCEPIAEWLDGATYDFICLQEVFTQRRIEMLTKTLVANNYTVLKPDDFKERKNLLSSGLITAIKNTVWTVVSSKFITFKQSVGAELLANKGFHIVNLKHIETGEPLLIINTHMQADDPTTYLFGCIDTRPMRKLQAEQIYSYIKSIEKGRNILIGDLNSEVPSHNSFCYLTGKMNGIIKHTFPETGEDLDHVAILPDFWGSHKKPVVNCVSVLTRLNWSDHWPVHVILDL